MATPDSRDRAGRFRAGMSGNPGGRPRSLMAIVRAETGDGAELVRLMVKIMRGKFKGAQLRDRMAAAEWLADRGFGRAPLPMEHSGPDGGPIGMMIDGARERIARRIAEQSARAQTPATAPTDQR